MSDEYHCDDCGKLLEECPFWIETIKIMEDIDSGKIEMVTSTAEEFLKELKELEDDVSF